jgi:hypothetical protein
MTINKLTLNIWSVIQCKTEIHLILIIPQIEGEVLCNRNKPMDSWVLDQLSRRTLALTLVIISNKYLNLQSPIDQLSIRLTRGNHKVHGEDGKAIAHHLLTTTSFKIIVNFPQIDQRLGTDLKTQLTPS